MIADSTVSFSVSVCDTVNMKRSFIAPVYTGWLCKTNITAINPNNPAPKMHEKLAVLRKRKWKCPLSATWNTKSKRKKKWVSSVGSVMFKGHLTDQRGPN